MDDETYTDRDVLEEVEELLEMMRQMKPEERNEKARRYAVTITELEKVHAYFGTYVCGWNRKIDRLTGKYAEE